MFNIDWHIDISIELTAESFPCFLFINVGMDIFIATSSQPNVSTSLSKVRR